MLVILDKDGTLVEPASGKEFVQSPGDQRLLPGVAERIAELKAMGAKVAIASNQGGVAAGHKSAGDAVSEMQFCQQITGIEYAVACTDWGHSITVIGDRTYFRRDCDYYCDGKRKDYDSFRKREHGRGYLHWRSPRRSPSRTSGRHRFCGCRSVEKRQGSNRPRGGDRVNKISATRIEKAARFLRTPTARQARGYLDKPLELTLRVLDSFADGRPHHPDEIAESTGLNINTIKQVLSALDRGGYGLLFTSHGYEPKPEGGDHP